MQAAVVELDPDDLRQQGHPCDRYAAVVLLSPVAEAVSQPAELIAVGTADPACIALTAQAPSARSVQLELGSSLEGAATDRAIDALLDELKA